jgi:hypothetical protein
LVSIGAPRRSVTLPRICAVCACPKAKLAIRGEVRPGKREKPRWLRLSHSCAVGPATATPGVVPLLVCTSPRTSAMDSRIFGTVSRAVRNEVFDPEMSSVINARLRTAAALRLSAHEACCAGIPSGAWPAMASKVRASCSSAVSALSSLSKCRVNNSASVARDLSLRSDFGENRLKSPVAPARLKPLDMIFSRPFALIQMAHKPTRTCPVCPLRPDFAGVPILLRPWPVG